MRKITLTSREIKFIKEHISNRKIGLTMDDLTQEELEQLEEEIKKVEENGPCFLDGVLFSIPPYSRSRINKRMKK